MKNLQPTELTMVVGGLTKKATDDLTLQFTTLQTQLKDATTASTNGNTTLMMAMALAMHLHRP